MDRVQDMEKRVSRYHGLEQTYSQKLAAMAEEEQKSDGCALDFTRVERYRASSTVAQKLEKQKKRVAREQVKLDAAVQRVEELIATDDAATGRNLPSS